MKRFHLEQETADALWHNLKDADHVFEQIRTFEATKIEHREQIAFRVPLDMREDSIMLGSYLQIHLFSQGAIVSIGTENPEYRESFEGFPFFYYGEVRSEFLQIRRDLEKVKIVNKLERKFLNKIQLHQYYGFGIVDKRLNKHWRVQAHAPLSRKQGWKNSVGKALALVQGFYGIYVMAYNGYIGYERPYGDDFAEPMRYVNSMPKGDRTEDVVKDPDRELFLSNREDSSGRKHGNHPVDGHYCYSRRSGSDSCNHDWKQVGRDGKRQRCQKCGKLRWWRSSHRRGDPALGIIERGRRIVK